MVRHKNKKKKNFTNLLYYLYFNRELSTIDYDNYNNCLPEDFLEYYQNLVSFRERKCTPLTMKTVI